MTSQYGWAFPEADVFMRGELQADGTYQRAHLEMALASVTDWTVAIDGGAHVGTWSRLLSARFQRVIAVEPAPDTYAALCLNMHAFDCRNVETQRVALGATAGEGAMGLDGREATRANTGGRYLTTGSGVSIVTIDEWVLPNLGLLKLDIEGSEPAALRGARETLERCRPIVIFENKGLWRRYGEVVGASQHVLRASGYRPLTRVGADEIWGPV